MARKTDWQARSLEEGKGAVKLVCCRSVGLLVCVCVCVFVCVSVREF